MNTAEHEDTPSTEISRNPSQSAGKKSIPLLPLTLSAAVLLSAVSLMLLGRVEQRTHRDMGDSLRAVLEQTEHAIQTWVNEEKATAEIWAAHPAAVEATKQLLAEPPNQEALIKSPAQAALREQLGIVVKKKYRGFFVIGPDNISLGSTRNANIGTPNLLVSQPDLLRRIWAGETLISAPQISDVPLGIETGGRDLSMFVGTPIRDDNGSVIALLTFRIDPYRSFVPLLKRSRIGETGETYAFDRNGRMISESHFNEALQLSGLLRPGESAMLNIELRDPGVNLTRGMKAPLPRAQQPLTLAAAEATAGRDGENLQGYRDCRGVTVVGAWIWDDDLGFGYATEIDIAESFATFRMVRAVWLTLTGSALLLIGLLHFLQARAIRRAIAMRTHLQAVVDNTVEGIITINAKGIIESWNPGAEKVFGYPAAEALGRNISMIMPEPHRSRHDGYLANYLRTGEARIIGFTRELEGRRQDGSLFPLQLSVSEMRIGGQVKFVGTVRDITALKQRERELHDAREAAEAANRAKGVFLANMSHEIRTPLNSILGFTRMLGRDVERDSERARQLETIHTNGERLLEMLDNVLEMSRLEKGEDAARPVRFNLPALLNDLSTIMQPKAAAKGLELRVRSLGELPVDVETDEAGLRIVLLHLLDNAVKFTTAGSVILRAVCPQPKEGERRLHFEVEDTGMGISPDDHKRILKVFEQGVIGSEMQGGAGLGLAICVERVRLLGGELSFTSEPKSGSVFRIEIPITAATGNTDIFTHAGGETRLLSAASEELSGPQLKERVARLPSELVDRIVTAANNAQLYELNEAVAEVTQTDAALAAAFRRLIERFDYESLVATLREPDSDAR